MIVGPASQWPMKEAIFFANPQIVDAGMPVMHQSIFPEFPVFVPVGAIPLSAVIVTFVSKTNSNAVVIECPKFLDESIVEFPIPFASQETDDFFAPLNEFSTISPDAIGCVSQRNLVRIARIPVILRLPHFENCGLPSKGRNKRRLRRSRHDDSPFEIFESLFEGLRWIFQASVP